MRRSRNNKRVKNRLLNSVRRRVRAKKNALKLKLCGGMRTG